MIPASVPTTPSSKSVEWAYWPAVVLIFIGGLALRSATFTQPWVGAHTAWGGAFYSNIARNFVRYGFWETKFAPVVNTGVVDPSQFEIYYHHPVLSMWLAAASFHVFGVHEWSARLAPLIFSLLTMALVFEFARAAFGKGTALVALLFMAVLPVDAYYATHVDPYGSMSIFLTMLAVEAYRRWLSSGRDRYYALCAISIVLGCMTAWYTFFVIPGIVAHGWLTQRSAERREMRVRVLMLPAFAVAVFGLFLLHREIALPGRPEAYGSLGGRILLRTVNLPLDRPAIIQTYFTNIWVLYTLPFVALTAAWVVLFFRDLSKKRLQLADWCIAILLSYGFFYGIVFPGHLIAHDYFVRAYAPGVALASAVVASRAAGALSRRAARLIVVGAIVGVTCVVAIAKTRARYATDDRSNGVILRGFGEAVATLTTPRDPVFMPIRDDKIISYYLDRPVRDTLDTPEKLEAAAAAAKGPYLIVVPERNASAFPELLAYLRQQYSERRDKGLFIFRPGETVRAR